MFETGQATEERQPANHVELPSIDRERLRAFANEYGLDLIVLFGSHAKGRARPDSDVDIGVWFEHPQVYRAAWRYDREKELRRELWRLFPVDGPEPDVVFLNRVDSLLQWSVARQGLPLYVRNDASWAQFRVYAHRRHRSDAKWRKRTAEFLRRKYGQP